MRFEVLKRHILRHALSTDIVQRVLQWERQKRCSTSKWQGPMAEKYCYNKKIIDFFLGREGEDKRRQKSDQT